MTDDVLVFSFVMIGTTRKLHDSSERINQIIKRDKRLKEREKYIYNVVKTTTLTGTS